MYPSSFTVIETSDPVIKNVVITNLYGKLYRGITWTNINVRLFIIIHKRFFIQRNKWTKKISFKIEKMKI